MSSRPLTPLRSSWRVPIAVTAIVPLVVFTATQLLNRKDINRLDWDIILLMADTRHNRSFLHSAGEGFLRDFPVPGQTALAKLERGRDPGGSAVILL